MKKVVVIGLGRMGAIVAQRLVQAGFQVVGFDPNATTRETVAANLNIPVAESLADVADRANIFWLMVPDTVVDRVLEDLAPYIQHGDSIIDGGNSKFSESIVRAQRLAERNIGFLDCGSSGGVRGLETGLSLMIGGQKAVFEKVESVFAAVAAPGGYAHVGPSGAGHYVKMVHNGIEYALLQAYAEGFQLIKLGHYKDAQIDLEALSSVWQHGSIIRSFILELARDMFSRDQNFTNITGAIAESGTGKWTVQEAHEQGIPVRVIEEALDIRAWSRETGGDYATKVVAMLRNQFGGHAVEKKS